MKLSKILLSTVAVMAISSVAQAAAPVQGNTGGTSTGSFEVSMEVREELKVSNLANLALMNGGNGYYIAGAGDLVGTEAFCIYYNNSNDVKLTIDSANGAGSGYALVNGADSISYAVEFQADTPGTGSFAAHNDGATVTYTIAANTANDDCATAGADTSSIRATVTDTGAPLPVANGTYVDTLTLTIAP